MSRDFFYYFFSTFLSKVVLDGSAKSTVDSIRRPMVANLWCTVPQEVEQVQIAMFLDRETAEIDAFIADQEELIGLLTERRAATISHAVTKGIDPSSPMEDSGIEVLGKVPVTWTVLAQKNVILGYESGVSVNAGNWPAGPDEIGVLKTSSVYTGEFDGAQNKTVVGEDLARVACPVRKGRIIVSRMNTPQLVGAAGLAQRDEKNLFLPDRLWQLEVGCSPSFFHRWTQSSAYRAQVSSIAVGTSASMQNISQDAFGSIKLAMPPKSEQDAIVAFLGQEVPGIEAAITDAREAITLSKERRAALISAAVTGKIDVRKHGGVE